MRCTKSTLKFTDMTIIEEQRIAQLHAFVNWRQFNLEIGLWFEMPTLAR